MLRFFETAWFGSRWAASVTVATAEVAAGRGVAAVGGRGAAVVPAAAEPLEVDGALGCGGVELQAPRSAAIDITMAPRAKWFMKRSPVLGWVLAAQYACATGA